MKEEENNNSHHSLLNKVKNHYLSLDENIFQKRILIAASAGPDSTALLHLCSCLFPTTQLMAVYIDHQLRPAEVPGEISLLQTLCEDLTISFLVEQVDVSSFATQKKLSIEEAARKLRHEVLEQIRLTHNFDYIALGHTEDDQIEEFFIRVIRGSNTAGLAGIKPLRGNLIRPLLQEKKAALISYLKDSEISFSIDSSNHDSRFLRNKIRHDLIPHLKRNYNESIDQSVLHFNAIFEQEDDYLDRVAVDWLHQQGIQGKTTDLSVQDLDISLPINRVIELHKAIQRRIVEKIIWQMDTRPSFATITSTIALLTSGKRGDEIHLCGGLRVLRQASTVLFHYPSGRTGHRDSCKKANSQIYLEITEPGTYHLQETGYALHLSVQAEAHQADKDTLIVDFDKITFPLVLRESIPGERFKPFGFAGTKKVNRFFNEKKLDKGCPKLCLAQKSNNAIIALPGLEISDSFKTDKDTRRFLLLKLQTRAS